MVKLKSFRYIESDSGRATDQDNQRPQVASTALSEAPSDISSDPSTIIGGNLTSEASSQAEIRKSTEDSNSREDQDDNDDQPTTLSSGEEYQEARLDISEDGDVSSGSEIVGSQQQVEGGAKFLLGESEQNLTSESDEPNNQSYPNPRDETQEYQPRQRPQNGPHIPTSPSAPEIQRVYLSRNRASSPALPMAAMSPLFKGKQRQTHQNLRSASPAIARRQLSMGDNLSQLSFGQRASGNHFEIRWHNINLMARKSKVPKYIADNPIYKLLFADSDKKHQKDADNVLRAEKESIEKIYYSPPIRHKPFSLNALPPQTISEDSEIDLTNNNALSASVNELASPPMFSPDQNPDDYRPILVNVSGSVSSGQLTAILGPSGVGKTMLLNSLTGRNTLEGTGKVSLIGSAGKRMSVVTVPQADVLPDKLTAIEDLLFTSRLRNPDDPNFNHKRNIQRVVKHLQMEKFLNTRIAKLSGGEARRLSIARELLGSPDILILDEPTSGLDANTCKKIITALRDIVEHSDNILDKPMSIIVTIHQPQREVLNLFHRVYIMAIGGRAIYEGPPTSLLPTIVENSSLSRVCAVDQLNENPAIVALEVASGEYGPNVIAELALHHESQVYEESLYGGGAATSGYNNSPFMTPRLVGSPKFGNGSRSPLAVSPRIQSLQNISATFTPADGGSIGRPTPIMAKRFPMQQPFDKMSTVTSLSYASTYDADLPESVSKLKVDKRLRRSVVMKSHFFSHTWTLMQRCWLLTTRDMFLMLLRVVGFVMVALGIVQFFAEALDPNEHQCPEYLSEVDDVAGYMSSTRDRMLRIAHMVRQSNTQHLYFFHTLLCVVMVTSALTGLVFPMQMRMFVREYKNGWYSPASFTMSQTLAELPADLIGPTITVLIAYPMCHQPTSPYYWREVCTILVMIIASNICKSQAQMISGVFMDSVENSVFLSCVAVTPPALLSGLAVRVGQMSQPLQILSYGSFIRYGFESLLTLRYGYGICPCDPELVNGYPTKLAADAMPARLENFAKGILELSLPSNETLQDGKNQSITENPMFEYSAENDDQGDNIFIRYFRLVSGASNLFPLNANDLGDCDRYRSLYLIDLDIPNNILPKWMAVLLLMWVISRFLTYFVIKSVIKFKRL